MRLAAVGSSCTVGGGFGFICSADARKSERVEMKTKIAPLSGRLKSVVPPDYLLRSVAVQLLFSYCSVAAQLLNGCCSAAILQKILLQW